MTDTLTTPQAAVILGVSELQVRRLCARGTLDATRPDGGRAYIITRESVERYGRERRGPGNPNWRKKA
jgi:excisionase family DNA binding protein